MHCGFVYMCVCVFYLFIRIVKVDYKHHITSVHLQFIRVVGGIIVHYLDLQQPFPHVHLVGLHFFHLLPPHPSRLYLKQESWRHFCSFRRFFCWWCCNCRRLMRKRGVKRTISISLSSKRFSAQSNPFPDVFAHLWCWRFLHCGWSVCRRLALETEGETVRGERRRWMLDSRVRLKQKDKTDKTKTVRRHAALAAKILSDGKAQLLVKLKY